MALNFGGGIGISMFVKNDGLDTAIAQSVNKLKGFANTFNEVTTKTKVADAGINSFIEKIEILSQSKMDSLKAAAAAGGNKYNIDADIASMNRLNDVLKSAMSTYEGSQKSSDDLDKLSESTERISKIWETSMHSAVNFAKGEKMMTAAAAEGVDAFQLAVLSVNKLPPALSKVDAALQKNFKTFATSNMSFKDYKDGYVNILKSGVFEKLSKYNTEMEMAVLSLAYKLGSGVVKKGWDIFKGVLSVAYDTILDITKAAINLGTKIISSLIPSFDSVGKTVTWLKDKIVGLADSFIQVTLGGLNLTTGFEAKLVAMDKQATAIGANYGKTGGALRKFSADASSMALKLNMGVEETSSALKAFDRAGSQFAAIGLKNAEAVAKATSVAGVNADQMGQQLKKMAAYGIKGNDLDQLMGKIVRFGKEGGDMGAALNTLPNIMQAVQQKAALMGQKLDGAKLASYAGGIANLGTMFIKLGATQEEAAAASQGVANGLISNQKSFQNMFAGTETQFSQALQGIGVGAGNIKVALASMKQGPSEFIASLAKMRTESGKTVDITDQRFNFMRGQFEQAFGEYTPLIMKAFQPGNEEMLKMIENAGGAADSLSKLGKEGYKTGYTLADQFQMISDRFEMNFRKHGMPAAQEFVNSAGAAFTKLNNQVSEIIADKGPMGALLLKMSEIHSLGALALIPQTLRPMAAAFGTLAKAMMPTVQALGAFGISVGDLFSPLGIFTTLIAGLGTWFLSLRASGKTTAEALDHISDSIADFLEEIPVYVDKFVAWIDDFFASIDTGFADGTAKIDWSGKWTRIFNAASKALSSIWGVIEKVAQGVWEGLGSGFDPDKSVAKSGIEKIGNYIGLGLRKAWDWVVNFVKTEVFPRIEAFGQGIYDQIQGSIDPNAGGYAGAYSVGQTIADGLIWIWDKLVVPGAKALWGMIADFASGIWSGLWHGVNNTGEKESLSKKTGELIGSAITSGLKAAADAVLDFAKNNPGVTAMLAASTGNYAGLAVAAGAGAAYVYNKATDRFGPAAIKNMQDALNEAAKATGVAIKASKIEEHWYGNTAGIDYDTTKYQASLEKLKVKLGRVNNHLFKDGWWDSDASQQNKMDTAVTKMITTQQKRLQDALESGDASVIEYRKKQLAESLVDADSIDRIVEAYSKATGKDIYESFDQVYSDMNSGLLPQLTLKLKDLGYMTDLSLDNIQKKAEAAGMAMAAAAGMATEVVAKTIAPAEQAVTDAFGNMKNSAFDAWDKISSKMNGGKPANKTSAIKNAPLTFDKMSADDTKKYESLLKDPSMKSAIAEAAKNLDGPVKKTVEAVLSTAFENAYAKIYKDTKKFTDAIINDKDFGLVTLVKDVSDILTTMWTTISDKITEAVGNIGEQIKKVMSDVEALTSGLETVSLGKALAADESGETRPTHVLKPGDDVQQSILDGVHNPDWYFANDGYRKTFLVEMGALREAIKGIQVSSTGGTTTKGGSGIPSNFGSKPGQAGR